MTTEEDDAASERRYNDQMMLIDRREVCVELRSLAKQLGYSQAELLRDVVAASLPNLRKRAAARQRETARRRARQAERETLDNHAAA